MRNIERKTVFFALYLMAAFLPAFFTVPAFAHGGEDHGDEKPKTTVSEKGSVTRSIRLGEYEMTFKHEVFEPDAQASAKLFVTKFQTNEPIGDANAAIEIESASGSITPAVVEKHQTAGSYLVKIPALPEGTYTVRVKLTYGGETDTATFSGVEVLHAHAEDAAEKGIASLAGTALVILSALVVLGLFGGLIRFALRAEKNEPVGKEAVSV